MKIKTVTFFAISVVQLIAVFNIESAYTTMRPIAGLGGGEDLNFWDPSYDGADPKTVKLFIPLSRSFVIGTHLELAGRLGATGPHRNQLRPSADHGHHSAAPPVNQAARSTFYFRENPGKHFFRLRSQHLTAGD